MRAVDISASSAESSGPQPIKVDNELFARDYPSDYPEVEATVLGSRNALPEDFADVLSAMREGLVPSAALNTHRAGLADVPRVFESWMDPAAGVIKAIVEV